MLWETLSALFQVVAIDVALAGDNAVVVGMAAAGLPALHRRRAIVIGIAAAAVLRIVFASFTVQLLQIVGLLLAGGLLLLWVAWKLWRELSGMAAHDAETAAACGESPAACGGESLTAACGGKNLTAACGGKNLTAACGGKNLTAACGGKSFGQAVWQIVIADVSMSMDNVLAVAGASRDHQWVLVAGLALSVALMGLAANLVAALLHRHRWIAYGGLLIVLYVAVRMIWDGTHEVMAYAAVPAA